MILNASDYLKIRNIIIYNKTFELYQKKDITITQISDTHISKMVSKEKTNNIVSLVSDIKPDYIVLNGDIIDTPSVLEDNDKKIQTRDFVLGCAEIAKTFYTTSNHDDTNEVYTLSLNVPKRTTTYNYFWNKLKRYHNVYDINNKVYEDDNIYLMGIKLTNQYYFSQKFFHIENQQELTKELKNLRKKLNNLRDNKVNIAAIHSPEFELSEVNRNILSNFDLILSGHAHGGCVPGFIDDLTEGETWGIISPKLKLFPKYSRGFIKMSDKTYHLIGSGIETIQESAPTILHPLNHLCYQYFDNITITGDPIYKDNPYIETTKVYTKTLKR